MSAIDTDLDTQQTAARLWMSAPQQETETPITDTELARYLNKWRSVSDVARAFSGWYNINDVRRFVFYLDGQYRQNVLLSYAETITESEEKLYFAVMVWLNWRIVTGQYDDALGDLYMAVGYPNKDAGQFFTPYSVSLLTAQMQLPADRTAALELAASSSEGKIRVLDPACGSGSMLCAAWEVALRGGYDDLIALYGQDIDPYCVVMARVNVIMRTELTALRRAAKKQNKMQSLVTQIQGITASPLTPCEDRVFS